MHMINLIDFNSCKATHDMTCMVVQIKSFVSPLYCTGPAVDKCATFLHDSYYM